jgi:hypothetical protein
MRHQPWILLVSLLLLPSPGEAAWQDALALSGYIRDSPLLWKPVPELQPAPSTGRRSLTNLLHARLNLRAYPIPAVTMGLELKSRLFVGDDPQALLGLTNFTGGSRTYFDWERLHIDEAHVVWVSTVDRAWINGDVGPLQVTVGRQRVAWGTGLVWNPIDLFNPSSPLDFDNEEKPGTDAGRAQLYLGPSSKLEVAMAPMRDADQSIAAAKVLLNHWEYDWIGLGGRRGPRTVLGGAWAGSIAGGGFRGEVLYSIPRQGLMLPGAESVEKAVLSGCVDGDYTFASSLYLHGAVLYNQGGTTGDAGGPLLIEAYLRRWLSPARLSLFAEAARDLSPLFRADLAGILNPYDLSWYVGPSLDWSAATNLDVIFAGLIFGGDPGTEFGDNAAILMARLKYSF